MHVASQSQSARSEEHIDDVDAQLGVQQDVLIQPWSSTDLRSQKSADATLQSAATQNRRSASSPSVSAIHPLQNNFISTNGQDVLHTLSASSGPRLPSSPAYFHNGQYTVESPVLQNPTHTSHGSINNSNLRPRTNLPVFGTTSTLAAHYGIPTRLPPIPRVNATSSTTHNRPPVPRFDESVPSTSTSYQHQQPVSDDNGFFQFDTVMADYLKRLNEENGSGGSAAPSSPAKASAQLEPSAEEAAQNISNALFGEFFGAVHYIEQVTHRRASGSAGGTNDFTSPIFTDWNDYLTSPFIDDETPFESFLDTPAAPNMPDCFQSPAVAGMTIGEESFEGMPLVAQPNSTGYADGPNDFAKMSLENGMPPPPSATDSGSASPVKPPVPNFDNLYTMSPSTPALEPSSTQTSPLINDVSNSANLNATGRRKKTPTGTRKNITPESLIPVDAPTQVRNYTAPSATSRKPVPAVWARKRARSVAFDEEDELAGSDAGNIEAPLNDAEAEAIAAKRRQNTLAARRSRKRKLEYQRELEEGIESARRERDMWKERAMMLRTLLMQHGQPDPFVDMRV
ncbi:hypothetical protein A7U60_g3782 [Sanghuangporus baumii]|uniref:BZIP domain-containing protein n=1 Tax=Sanghuangporus baumii TaxID=108892 RepID=A0A9Q5HZW4_SANBA|nr:hypothetical protein A7U60_g3782 [Sanghuangporus baumii]